MAHIEKAIETACSDVSQRVEDLLARMTQAEKIGQLCQVSAAEGYIPDHLRHAVAQGQAGSVINEIDANVINELQRIAVHESRLGIPLLIGRDVIHGYKTIFPIPLGQAASWSTDIVRRGAEVAAIEASSMGINWTFAPMIDISRDPRWGRIAESLGEDPHLCSVLTVAMVEGYQGDDMAEDGKIAACAKHFCGYGASESGKDYCTTNIPENELRNVYMRPFKAASDHGVASFMSSFSDLDGIPATANAWLMDQVLRGEWQYQGFIVSDWESISQLTIHGLCEDTAVAAMEAFNAGIDMEMVSTCYRDHLPELLERSPSQVAQLDQMVRRLLTAKFNLGLFDKDVTRAQALPDNLPDGHLQAAKQAALESCVLLQNKNDVLPLDSHSLNKVALIGPLADDGYEQLGTWIFDGEARHTVTVLQGIHALLGDQCELNYHRAMQTSRSHSLDDPARIEQLAQQNDAVILILGEESILSGEAHCRAELGLPGCQEQLIELVAAQGKPVVLVVLAGRPLTLEPIIEKVDAILYAWHPGTMGGPAIADLLFGEANPSGKLPVTFPRKVGQIPIYYSQKPSGKPVSSHNYVHMDHIPVRAAQTSLGMAASHLDTHYTPLYPFGFGLSYSRFSYNHLVLSQHKMAMDDTLFVSVTISNDSDRQGTEIVQLYIQDLVGSITRPPKELKGFQRVSLDPGQHHQISFELTWQDLAFYGRDKQLRAEPGRFKLWVGGSSAEGLEAEFTLEANHS